MLLKTKPSLATHEWPFFVPEVDGNAAISWERWANKTMIALSHGPTEDDRDAAITMLQDIAAYLDRQYQQGYDGIALIPRENFTLTFDR